MKLIGPEGERYAHEVLGVSENASDEEISKAYRALVKQYHPDRVSDPAAKLQASEHFMQIQRAYEILSSIHTRRASARQRARNR